MIYGILVILFILMVIIMIGVSAHNNNWGFLGYTIGIGLFVLGFGALIVSGIASSGRELVKTETVPLVQTELLPDYYLETVLNDSHVVMWSTTENLQPVLHSTPDSKIRIEKGNEPTVTEYHWLNWNTLWSLWPSGDSKSYVITVP